MATNTKNLNLKKPSQEDFYNVEDFNENFQKIDDFASRKDNPHGVTAEQTGALPSTGGTLTGDLYFKSAGDVLSFLFSSGGRVNIGTQMGEHRSQLHINSPDANLSYGILFVKDGNNYSLFGEHNKELMSLYFLPLSGGKVTGNITAPSLVLTNYAAPIEIGQYIDMHIKNSTSDFDGRIHISESGDLLYSKTPETNFEVIHSGNYLNFENIKTGIYTGTHAGTSYPDNPVGQFINLGFTPKAVLVLRRGTLTENEDIVYGGLALPNNPVIHKSSNAIAVSIKNNGFSVYSDKYVSANNDSHIYHYMAWK